MAASTDIRGLLDAEPTCRLPRGTRVDEVADECRRALVDFVSTCRTTSDVDAWLEGPYRAVTEHLPSPVRSAEVHEPPAVARAHVLAVIREVADEASDVSFSLAVVTNGWVERCVDATGRPGWVPVDRPKMRLTERLLSLLAVDYLVRPEAWLGVVPVELQITPTLSRIAI